MPDALHTRPEVAQAAAGVLKALGHPLRLQIVAVLVEGHEHVTGLSERLGVNQAVVSQQLRILRMSGLVTAVRENGFASYRIAEPGLHSLVACVEHCAFCRWARDAGVAPAEERRDSEIEG